MDLADLLHFIGKHRSDSMSRGGTYISGHEDLASTDRAETSV